MAEPAVPSQPDAGSTFRTVVGSWLPVLVVLLTAGGFVAYAVHDGLTVTSAVRQGLGVLVTQVIPGAIVWRSVRPRAGWLVEDLLMGFAVGVALAVVAQVCAGLTHAYWLATAIPVVIGACLLAVPVTRRRVFRAASSALPWWWSPVLGATSLVAIPQLRSYFPANAPVLPPGVWQPHIDTYLHLALASELKTRGPVQWPTVAGEDLGYQWLGHAWIAQVSTAGHVELIDVLTRFMPAILPIVLVATTAVAALRLSGRPVVGAVAGVVCMLGSNASPFGFVGLALPLTPLSPTLGIGAPTLIAMVVLLAVRWRGEALTGAFWLLPLLTVVAAGTKGSTSPLVVAGLGVASGAMLLWNRPMLRRLATDFVVVALFLALTFVVVFHGSSAGLQPTLSGAAVQTGLYTALGGFHGNVVVAVVALVTTVAAIGSRAIPAFALPFYRDTRRDPVTWLLLGAVTAGACAVGVFQHPGHSQYYFASTAIPLMAMGCALGLGRLWEAVVGSSPTPATRVMAWTVAVVGLVGGAVATGGAALLHMPVTVGQVSRLAPLLAWFFAALAITAVVSAGLAFVRGRRGATAPVAAVVGLALGVAILGGGGSLGLRWLGDYRFVPPHQVKLTASTATTQYQIDGARWIRDHSGVEDLVMTNRHCTVPRPPVDGCDSRRWIVTAFSERQSLVEGWTATPRATRLAPQGRASVTINYWKPQILQLNDGFIAAPTAAAARQLWGLGVRWVYVDHTRPYASTLEPYAVHRYGNPDVDVYQLLKPT